MNHVLELSTQRTGDWQRQGLGLCEKLQVREEKSRKRVGNGVGRAELIDLLSATLFEARHYPTLAKMASVRYRIRCVHAGQQDAQQRLFVICLSQRTEKTFC